MRLWLLTFAALSVSVAPAVAADEFGARFNEEAPLALDDSANALEDIAPAAGSEETPAIAQTPPASVGADGVLEENPAQSLLKSEEADAAAPDASITQTQPSAGEPQEAEQIADEEAAAAPAATPAEEAKEAPAAQ